MPIRVDIMVEGEPEFSRTIRERSELTQRQVERLAEGVAAAVRGPHSRWPKKGGGVRGQATGYSRPRWRARATRTRNGIQILLHNPSRAITRRTGGKGPTLRGVRRGRQYAQYREAGIPNRRTRGDVRRTIEARWPNIVRRVFR